MIIKKVLITKKITRKRRGREITVHSIGTPNLDLAAEMFSPLFLKIHIRNKTASLKQF